MSLEPLRLGRFPILIWLVSLAFLLSAGCRRTVIPPPPEQKEITVAAASNLSDAMTELARQFTVRTGIQVVTSFGATGDLSKQIENGAPFDVFLSSDRAHIDSLQQKNLLVADSVEIYARGVLVLWMPPGAKYTPPRLENVAGPEISRIGVAKPDLAPYGQATVEALQALGVWQQVQPKIVYGENVSQVRQFAATGNVDVAFLPLALVHPGEGTYIEVPESLHKPIEQFLGIIRDSQRQQAARKFAAFVLSQEGQDILKKYGYEPPRRPALL